MRKLLLALVLLIVLIAYTPTANAFFQQDEWNTFARFMTTGLEGPNVFHFTPLTESFFYLHFHFLKFNYPLWAFSSIALHLITVYLVYFLAKQIFQNDNPALLTATIFGISATTFQATSWMSASTGTHMATIFALLSIIYFIKKRLALSLILLIISLLFKEISIALFICLPLLVIIFPKTFSRKNISTILLTGASYFIFRLFLLLNFEATFPQTSSLNSQSIDQIFYNLFSFPVKIISQNIIPSSQIIRAGNIIASFLPETLTGTKGTTAFDIFVQRELVEIISYSVFIILIILIAKLFRQKSTKKIVRIASYGFLFAALNGLIYALSPGRSGIISIVDSRNLYFPSIGTSILISSIVVAFAKFCPRITYLLTILFIATNITLLNQRLASEAKTGALRKSILVQIKQEYPHLPDKVIIFTQSDSPFYGTAESERILPFQNNFGFTLMTWYQQTENFPNDFIDKRRFLRGFTGQGYKETNNQGFGYFRDINLLAKTVTQYSLPKESIIAYRFESKTNKLTDISIQIRDQVFQ